MVLDARRRRDRRRAARMYCVFDRLGVEITNDVQKVDGRRHVAVCVNRNGGGQRYLEAGTHELSKRVEWGVSLRRRKAC
jgi:hypothetical protein